MNTKKLLLTLLSFWCASFASAQSGRVVFDADLLIRNPVSFDGVQFHVPNSGNGVVPMSFPTLNGVSGTILTNNGSGALYWSMGGGSSPVTSSLSGSGSVAISGSPQIVGVTSAVISISTANGSTNGILLSSDWNSFNTVATALNGVTGSVLGSYLNGITANIQAQINASGSSGANTSLSNLSATAINQNLAPDGTGNHTLGTVSNFWGNIVMNGDIDDGFGRKAMTNTVGTRMLFDATGSLGSIDFDSRWLVDSTGGNIIADWSNVAGLKLNSTLASFAVSTDGTNHLRSSATTAAELDFVHGVTSGIQAQLNSTPYTATTPGDWAGSAPTHVQQALDRLAACAKSGACTGTGP